MNPQSTKSNIIIKKSNKLIESRYKLGIWEMRVLSKAISMIRMEDTDFKKYRIYLSEMIEEFGLNKGAAYKYLVKGAEDLNDRSIILYKDDEIDGKKVEKRFKTNLVAGVESFKNDTADYAKYIEVSLHPDLKDSLLQLKSNFTKYNISNVVNLPSSYSYRVYELLKQFESIGHRSFELDDLKEMLGATVIYRDGLKEVKKDTYPLYGNFKQKVLLKAQRDLLEYTDINFTFDPIKKGRKVSGVKFFIRKNKPKTSKQPNRKGKYTSYTAKQESTLYETLEPRFEDWKSKPNKTTILNLLEEGYTETHIIQAITYTQQAITSSTRPIGNPAGYFRKMVVEAAKQGQLDFATSTPVADKQETQKKKKELQQQIAALTKQYKELVTEKQDKRDHIISKLLEKTPTLYLETAIENKGKRTNSYNYDADTEENMKHPSIRAFINNAIVKKYPDEFTELQQIQDQIDIVRSERDRLV